MKRLIVYLLAAMLLVLAVGCSNVDAPPNGEDTPTDKTGSISAEERQRLDLYLEVMKSAFNEENGGDSFIAVKLDTLEGLGEAALKDAMEELKALSPSIYSFEEISKDTDKFEIDTNGNLVRTLDGALLWIVLEAYDNNKAVIEGVSWFGNLGAVFPKYEATYKNGRWELKLISMAVS